MKGWTLTKYVHDNLNFLFGNPDCILVSNVEKLELRIVPAVYILSTYINNYNFKVAVLANMEQSFTCKCNKGQRVFSFQIRFWKEKELCWDCTVDCIKSELNCIKSELMG